jgi:hypothetical protein
MSSLHVHQGRSFTGNANVGNVQKKVVFISTFAQNDRHKRFGKVTVKVFPLFLGSSLKMSLILINYALRRFS